MKKDGDNGKPKVTKCEGFKIREMGPEKFMADCHAHGKRARKVFKTLEEAQTFCRQKRVEVKNVGRAAFNLSDQDRRDLQTARQTLGEVPLMQAVNFYVAHHPKSDPITVDALVELFLAAPGKRGKRRGVKRRPDTLQAAKWRLAAFTKVHGTRMAHEINATDITEWLATGGWEGRNRNHYIAVVRAMFNFAVEKGYCGLNPADGVELQTVVQRDPDIMTVDDVSKLLCVAGRHEPALLPRLVLSFFCGLRPRELDRLGWKSVSLENKLVTVGRDVAKIQGHRRTVTIPDNAIAWLRPYKVGADKQEKVLSAKEISSRIDLGLNAITDAGKRKRMKKTFDMYHGKGMTIREIASRLKVASGTISRDLSEIEELVSGVIVRRQKRQRADKVCPVGATACQSKLAALQKKSGVNMPNNAGRHAFASYHLALHGNAPLTAGQMGHSDVKLLLTTYRNINTIAGETITEKMASTYFEIRPQSAGKVIQLPA